MDTPKIQIFNGVKFVRDDRTGYYLCSTIKKRMHRYVWEYYNGEIPSGYDIHHKDGNKANNDIENLEMIERKAHKKYHCDKLTDEQRQWRRDNMNNKARPKAIEWHKSEMGKEWHKKQYEQYGEALHRKYKYICQNCGKQFEGEFGSKFCCNACKSAYRRKSGVDNVKRICVICGKEFDTSKYSKVKTCSRSCANKLKWRNRKDED